MALDKLDFKRGKASRAKSSKRRGLDKVTEDSRKFGTGGGRKRTTGLARSKRPGGGGRNVSPGLPGGGGRKGPSSGRIPGAGPKRPNQSSGLQKAQPPVKSRPRRTAVKQNVSPGLQKATSGRARAKSSNVSPGLQSRGGRKPLNVSPGLQSGGGNKPPNVSPGLPGGGGSSRPSSARPKRPQPGIIQGKHGGRAPKARKR